MRGSYVPGTKPASNCDKLPRIPPSLQDPLSGRLRAAVQGRLGESRTNGCVPSSRLAPLQKPLLVARLHVALGQPSAGFDELHDVDQLFRRHHGKANPRDDPGPEAVHLVGPGKLEGAGAVWVGEDLSQERRIDLCAHVNRRGIGARDLLQESRREEGAREREQIQCDEEGLVQGTEDEEDRLGWFSAFITSHGTEVKKEEGRGGSRRKGRTYPVGIVQIQNPASRLVDVLVALIRAAHGQSGVHVHIMAREIERDQALEDDGPAGEGGREEDEQAGGRAAIGHHVEDGAEAGRLVEVARGIAVEGIEEARDAVQERARSRVQGHVVERGHGEHDSRITCSAPGRR